MIVMFPLRRTVAVLAVSNGGCARRRTGEEFTVTVRSQVVPLIYYRGWRIQKK